MQFLYSQKKHHLSLIHRKVVNGHVSYPMCFLSLLLQIQGAEILSGFDEWLKKVDLAASIPQ